MISIICNNIEKTLTEIRCNNFEKVEELDRYEI